MFLYPMHVSPAFLAPQSPSIMQSAIRAAIEYIEASHAAGTPADTMVDVTSHRVDNLRAMLGKSSPSIGECTASIVLVGHATVFSQCQKQALLSAIHTMMNNCSTDDAEEMTSPFDSVTSSSMETILDFKR